MHPTVDCLNGWFWKFLEPGADYLTEVLQIQTSIFCSWWQQYWHVRLDLGHFEVYAFAGTFPLFLSRVVLDILEKNLCRNAERVSQVYWFSEIISFFAGWYRGVMFRPYWYVVHWLFGTTMIILAWFNIFKGLDIYVGSWIVGELKVNSLYATLHFCNYM